MAKKDLKKAASSSGQRTLQETWSILQPPSNVPQQRAPDKKRKAEDEPTTLQATRSTIQQPPPVPQRKKGKAKQPVEPPTDSEKSDTDPEDDYVDISDEDEDDDFDDRSAEEIEETERVQLLHTLESQDALTVDQAVVLEPLETCNQENDRALELSLEAIESMSSA
jgi:hypothetical protein